MITSDPRIVIASLLVCAGAGCFTGWKLRDGDYQRHLKQDAVAAAKTDKASRSIEQSLVTISSASRQRLDQKEVLIRTQFKTIVEKVPYYVTNTVQEKAVVAGGGLPLGFVWVHNAAALGVNPPAASPSGPQSGDPSGVDLSTLARVAAGNYELYHQCRARLEEWDSFYDQLTAKWPSQKENTQ